MAHKFKPINKQKLDNEWRRENLPPKSVLEELGLIPDDIVADIGCGIGYFTLPAARIVGPNNKVYALDTSEEMLEEVKRRTEEAGLSNINMFKTNEYDIKIASESVSFVIVVNVLHEIDDKLLFMKEIKRVLKYSGRVALIEWDKKPMSMGPSIDHRLSKEEAEQIFNTVGFSVKKNLYFSDSFYGMVAVKQ